MYTEVAIQTSNPTNTSFIGQPESLEKPFRKRIIKVFDLIDRHTPDLEVTFEMRPIYKVSSCGSRKPIAYARFCIIRLSGPWSKTSIRRILRENVLRKDQETPVTIAWRFGSVKQLAHT